MTPALPASLSLRRLPSPLTARAAVSPHPGNITPVVIRRRSAPWPRITRNAVDRELIELLNEIRVVLPGAQVLFAFLLTLPFTQRFEGLSAADRDAYFAAFICTALGTSMLMAPTMHHRLRFREHDKERMLLGFNKLILVGSVFLAAAIALSVYVVTGMLFQATWASVVGAAIAAWLVALWYVLPLVQRRGRELD